MPRAGEGEEVARGEGRLVFNGDRVSVWEGEKFRGWMMVRVAGQCESTSCH